MQRSYSYNGSRLAGVILILVGVLLLLGSMLSLTAWVFGGLLWPLALLLIGGAFLERQWRTYRRTGRLPFPWPLFLLLWGALGLLKSFGIYSFGLLSWPSVLIVTGLWMLLNRR